MTELARDSLDHCVKCTICESFCPYSAATPLFPESSPVTVCAPATFAVHTFPLHDPSGPIEKTVDAVTSPRALPDLSKPSAVYACEPPAATVALAGLTTM